MRVKVLVPGEACDIVAVMEGEECPAEQFIQEGEASTYACRVGLLTILQHIADKGLQGVPSTWVHEANKKERIYEVIKGPLRLLFFKGEGRQVAVCTTGVRKQGQKADRSAVNKAAAHRKLYEEAVAANALKVVIDHDEDEDQ